jgi:nitrogen fixation protein FixH
MSDKPKETEDPAEASEEEATETEGEEKTEGAEEKPAAPPSKSAKKQMPAWVGLAAIVFFLVLAMGVGYVVWLVVNTFGLVQEDANRARATQGRVVEKLQQDDLLGRGSELLIDKKLDKAARIRFLLRDGNRQPVPDAVVNIKMLRPDDPQAPPILAKLQMLEPGVYRGEVNLDKGGVWEAQILVQEGKSSYQVTKRIALPEKEPEPVKEPGKEAAPEAGKK